MNSLRIRACNSTVLIPLALLVLLGTVGCSGEDNAGDGLSIADASLTTDGFFLPEVVDSEVAADGGSIERLGYLEGCSDNEDCRSGWCVASPMGYVCSRICFERNDCEEGWSCLVVSNTPPDVTSICLPPTNRLCNLCTVDRDCPGGHCYELDGESVCGLDCNDEVQCPDNYTCSEVVGRQTCLPNTNSCSCSDENSGEVRFCERRNDFGACVGREVCDPTIGWSGCSASEPLSEICNGLDDDCNGFNDDIFGLGELCEREADVSGERISCAGVIVCSDESPQPICTATDPMEETCNFLDDDCDGETDEGFDENGEICVVGTGRCQRIGVFECSPEGDVVQCSVEPNSPSDELCDGLDNDCDEQVDENFPDLNNICTVGEGACQAAGVWQCSNDFESRVCSAIAREASQEFCDSIDNDCDDNIDEDFPNILEPCARGEGACRRQGFIFCADDALGTACTAEAGIPAVEICNGLDDDCDGNIDEGYAGVNQPCFAGEGICRTPGITVCTEDGAGIACNAVAGEPSQEVCNGLDDNCDGTIDEAFAELGRPCESDAFGVCRSRGVYECAPDGLTTQCDAPIIEPSDQELCNGLDDNCDGETDENFPLADTLCRRGDGVCERAGRLVCNEGGDALVCTAIAGEPSEEICNGLDDNCDGAIDEGFEGVSQPCFSGAGTCRAAGITVCSEDGSNIECNAVANPPSDEVCNGLDDNCDGTIDEGYAGVNQPCFAGDGICRTPGITVCTEDGAGIACNAVAGEPSQEVCNGLDDNCDGTIDEAFAELGRPCESDAFGVCRSRGVYECALDGLTTQCDAPIIAPAEVELCNGLDDNCDGEIDENFPLIDSICTSGAGLCQRSGRFVCNDAEDDTVCTATAGQPSQEVCNGLDDNCDGAIDEGFEGVSQPCFSGAGTCRAAGITVCSEDGSNIECNAVANPPSDEVCNGLDDNCDGTIDEGYAGVNQPCFAGDGTCRVAGLTVCSDDGASVECNADANPPSDEICNGLDDNCDGTIDEGFDGVNQPCFSGDGTCRVAGLTVCSDDGASVECNAVANPPSAEMCNGLDDNCNGETDEAFPNLGSLCDSGGIGICQSRGVYECARDGAQAVCNAAVIQPANNETCNGLDDNCNGEIDESYPLLNTICTVGQGACEKAGIFVCDPSGNDEVCNATAGDPSEELCNRLDDNCDGQVDENFPTVGEICNAGEGLCRRSGVINCDPDNPAGEPVCDAEAVVPQNPGVDTCDYQDDDCDGNVDERFLDENGRYSQVGNCGACGTDCQALWDPNPAAFGVIPTCSQIANTTQCSFTCLAGFIDADGVASNGCELAPDEGVIYVQSPSNGGIDDVNCGLVQVPCATITYALERAQLDNKQRVRVAEGSYQETVTLVSGVDLIGGHQRVNWERNPDLYASVIFGADSDDVHKAAVKALSITSPTLFDGFSVNAEPVLFEGNSYGIYILDSDANLTVSNHRILAANGGIGKDGDSGTSGPPGPNGAGGLPSYLRTKPNNCNTASFNDGADGGQLICNATTTSGGNGGSAVCPRQDRQEGTGADGGTNLGGGGGEGAYGATVFNAGTCTVSDGGLDAFPGSAGGPGIDGVGGNGATATIGGNTLHWQGNPGSAGVDGNSGGGGGGGGAAAGVDITITNPDSVIIGASGGGGGAGGCSGELGDGGQSGGGSFGIFVVFDNLTPNNADDFPNVIDNSIWRGLGGRGGSGGKGGAGGEGGLGGLGGPKGDGTLGGYAFCSLSAGEGGTGGRGGHAGGGGGGQGGNSFDIFIVGSNNVNSGYENQNVFPIGDDESTAGVGGEGGNSSNTLTGEGNPGTAGLDGQFGQSP